MKISTKGRYALRIMIDLADHDTGDYMALKEIAKRQEISEKYLESIVSSLVRADFVTGLRGKGGGYKLTRSPADYTVGSILRLTEGNLAPVACLDCMPNTCARSAKCKTLPMWEGLSRLVNEYLNGITLDKLIDMSDESDYYII